MRRFLLASLVGLAALPAFAGERWEMLPTTPAPVATDRGGQAQVNGISIHYAVDGHGSPVIFLHGGLANIDYWGNQVPEIAAHHTVIPPDSRGHGRSTRDAAALWLRSDGGRFLALMDRLGIPKGRIVGWSDGGILGIDLAMRHKDRIGKACAFADNAVNLRCQGRRREEPDLCRLYRTRRPGVPDAFGDTPGLRRVRRADQQDVGRAAELDSDAQLKAIDTPILVVDGDHDEAIKLEHTEYIAATIPHARAVDPAKCESFRLFAGPQAIQFRHSPLFGRRVGISLWDIARRKVSDVVQKMRNRLP